jgi:hypothetical protein
MLLRAGEDISLAARGVRPHASRRALCVDGQTGWPRVLETAWAARVGPP